MSVTIGGMFSGLDTQGIISQLTALNRQPITVLQRRQATLGLQDGALGNVASSVDGLRSRLAALGDSALFARKAATVSDSAVGTASVTSSATPGTARIEITQLATASRFTGSKASPPPAATATLDSVFGPGAAGTLTINGSVVTLTGSMTLAATATALQSALGAGTASYDPATGRFALAGSSPLALGSGTSNFLQQAQLFTNGTADVTSANGVGRLDPGAVLSAAWPGVSAGALVINGVTVSYTASDTLADVLGRIGASDAGVSASYDSYQDRIVLTARHRGANAITVHDAGGGTLGSLLGATTSLGTLALGANTRFRVNDGELRSSVDGTLDGSELGYAGLTFTAARVGVTQVTVGADTAAIRSAVEDFVGQYNSLQNIISSYIRVDPKNPGNSGPLANDSTLTFLPAELRAATTSPLRPTGAIRMLEDIGVRGNGTDATLALADPAALETAIRDRLPELADLFTAATSGLSARLGRSLEAYSGATGGILATRRNSLTSEQTRLGRDIDQLEARLLAESDFLRTQFAALEAASGRAQQFSSFFNQFRPTS